MLKNKRLFLLIVISALIFLILAYLLYFFIFKFYFNSNIISGKTTDWGAFGDYVGGVLTPIFTFLTIILLVYSLFAQEKEYEKMESRFHEELDTLKNQTKLQNYNDFVKIYYSSEMTDCINKLWEYYDKANDKNDRLMKLCRENNDIWEKKDKARRYVSNYFQHLSILLENKLLDENLVFTFWNKNSLEIIKKIIIPLEELVAEKNGLKKEDVNVSCLLNLYNKAEEYEKKNT